MKIGTVVSIVCGVTLVLIAADMVRVFARRGEPESGNSAPRVVQIANGPGCHAALFSDGTVRRWGRVNCAKDPAQVCDRNVKQEASETVEGLNGVVQIGVGEERLCALFSDGTVSCADDRRFTCDDCDDFAACLDDRPIKVAGLENIVEIGMAGRSACARSSRGEVYCWGDLSPPSADQDMPTLITGEDAALRIAVSDFAACAIMIDGSVMCWGYVSDITEDAVDDLAPYTPPVYVDGVNDAVGISVNGGSFHAVLDDGTVREWSVGNVLRKACLAFLNNGAAVQLSDYDPHADECIESDIYLAGDGPLSEPVDGVRNAASIENSVDGGTCAVLKDGRVSCWKWDMENDEASGRERIKIVGPSFVQNVEHARRYYNDWFNAQVITVDGASLVFDHDSGRWKPLW